jgi:hypothetical protein
MKERWQTIMTVQSGHVQTTIVELPDDAPYRYKVESRSHLRHITPCLFTNDLAMARRAVADQIEEMKR